ncbi:MAG: nuclear transport factor 2 family protein [Candidatus Binatia bacterium]
MSTLEEKDAIRELMAHYCFRFDNGEFESWLDLFTDDGAFDLGTRGRFTGRDALRDFLKTIPLTDGLPMVKHCTMNTVITVNAERATGWSYVVVLRGGDALDINLAGRYEDQLVKVGGTWRFKERKVHFDFLSRR